MRALWSDRPNCSHNVSQKVKRIRRLSDLRAQRTKVLTRCRGPWRPVDDVDEKPFRIDEVLPLFNGLEPSNPRGRPVL